MTGLAETFIIGDQALKATAGVGIIPFFTEGWTSGTKSSRIDNSWEITLGEMANGLMGGDFGIGSQFNSDNMGKPGGNALAIVKRNMASNGVQAVLTAVATPVIFRGMKKVFRKPINAGNRLLKGTGVRI